MQYLFNKVYLSLDNAFEIGTDCVLITPLIETFPTDEFELAVTQSDLGPIIASGTSFEEAAASVGGERELFDAITNVDPTKKVLIYATPAAYITVLCKWLKALLPNLDSATAYDVVSLTLIRLKNTHGYPYVPHKLLTKEQALQYNNLPLALVDRATFEDQWSELVPFDMSTHGRQYYAERCGIEFLLATYFADSQTPLLPVVEDRVTTIAQSMTLDIITDQFNRVVRRPSVIPEYDVHTQTLDQWVVDHPRYAPLVDQRLSSSDLEYALATYDFGYLNDLYLEVIQWLGLALDPKHPGAPRWTSEAVTLDTLINAELASPQYPQFLAVGKRSMLINTYLLDRLFNEKRAGKQTLATKLSLDS